MGGELSRWWFGLGCHITNGVSERAGVDIDFDMALGGRLMIDGDDAWVDGSRIILHGI